MQAGSGAFPELSLRPRVYQRPHPAAARGGEPARLGGARRRAGLARRDAFHADRDRGTHSRSITRPSRHAEPPGTGPYRPRLLLCSETYVAETAEIARAEGALALQGFWHLSSLAAPPPPASTPTTGSRR